MGGGGSFTRLRTCAALLHACALAVWRIRTNARHGSNNVIAVPSEFAQRRRAVAYNIRKRRRVTAQWVTSASRMGHVASHASSQRHARQMLTRDGGRWRVSVAYAVHITIASVNAAWRSSMARKRLGKRQA